MLNETIHNITSLYNLRKEYILIILEPTSPLRNLYDLKMATKKIREKNLDSYCTFTESFISPYRIWVRYQIKNWEFRLGLQKIDFGSAQLLRPIQWFNQIDPRDPLGLTNGVNGLLVRRYFKNNSNLLTKEKSSFLYIIA